MSNTITTCGAAVSCTISNLLNTDVHIHKDDGLTQRNNAAGITVSVDFDTIIGSHMIKIDTNDNTVAGFWVAGHDYFVRIEGATIDYFTINAVVAHFSIENRLMRGTDSAATAAALTTHDGKLDTVDGNVDAILVDTGTTLENHMTTIEGYTDKIDDAADGLTAIKAEVEGLGGAAMRGTDGANTVVPDAAGVAPTAVENAIAVWDRILSGATHNIAASAGRRVREIGAYAIHSGTAQAGNGHSITLAAGAAADDGVYNRNLIVITDNTGVGQSRVIVDYNGTSKVAIVDRDWRVEPNGTSAYQIVADDTPLVVDQGLAQAGSATTVTLRAYASSEDDIYMCNIITIIAGTGRGQARLVGSYDGTSKILTICGDDFTVNPDTTSVYVLMPYGAACVSCLTANAKSQINTECDTALSDVNLDKHDQNMHAIIFSE